MMLVIMCIDWSEPDAGFASEKDRAGESKHSCCSGMRLAVEPAKDAGKEKKSKKDKSKDEKGSKDESKDPKTADAAAADRKPVLDPSQFAGLASFGYASAKAAPEVMEKLFCYCGCDLTDSHTSLLDCFTSAHGVDCHICQEEAVLALKLHRDGMPMKQIQQEIDERYSDKYPFEEQTPAYKKYKTTRLWTTQGTASDTTATNKSDSDSDKNASKEAAGPAGPDASAEKKTPKVKPGRTVGKCCSAGHEHKDSKQK